MDRRFHSLRIPLAAVLALTTVGCQLFGPEEELSHPWVRDGAQLVYDFRPAQDLRSCLDGTTFEATEGALVIDVTRTTEAQHQIKVSSPKWNCKIGEISIESTIRSRFKVKRHESGLLRIGSSNCDGWFSSPTESVWAPANPERGDRVAPTGCGSSPLARYTVAQVNVTITVPAGTFATYVMEAAASGVREYWAPETGLIRIDRLDEYGNLACAYELAEIHQPGFSFWR